MVSLEDMGCCAFTEVVDIKGTTPLNVLKHICRESSQNYLNAQTKMWHRRLMLSAFYVFTAMVENTRSGRETDYGQSLAAYIRKNKLGKVMMTPARVNRVNHPTHMVRGWIWMPEVDMMSAWWEANGDKYDY